MDLVQEAYKVAFTVLLQGEHAGNDDMTTTTATTASTLLPPAPQSATRFVSLLPATRRLFQYLHDYPNHAVAAAVKKILVAPWSAAVSFLMHFDVERDHLVDYLLFRHGHEQKYEHDDRGTVDFALLDTLASLVVEMLRGGAEQDVHSPPTLSSSLSSSSALVDSTVQILLVLLRFVSAHLPSRRHLKVWLLPDSMYAYYLDRWMS